MAVAEEDDVEVAEKVIDFSAMKPGTTVFPNFIERYTTPFFSLLHDQYVYRHSNHLMVVGLAPTHPIVTSQSEIDKVEFSHFASDLKLTGKSKRGAAWVLENTVMMKVTLKDGTQHSVYTCVDGKVIDANERLLTQPMLLRTKPGTEGWVGILSPKQSDRLNPAAVSAHLTTRDEFCTQKNIQASALFK